MPTDKTLVCRRCKVMPKLIKEEGRSDTVRCPICGASADLHVASRVAAKYELHTNIADDLSDNIARIVKGSKFIRHVRHNRPKMSAPAFTFK